MVDWLVVASGAFWGLLATVLGYNVSKNWQAWAIIFAGTALTAVVRGVTK